MCNSNSGSDPVLSGLACASALLALIMAVAAAPVLAENIAITDRASVFSLPAGKVTKGIAQCEPGELILSGGFALDSSAYRNTSGAVPASDWYFVSASYPDGTNAWTVRAANATSRDEFAVVHAYCAALPPALLEHRDRIVIASSGVSDIAAGKVSATCPESYRAIGGGFRFSNIDQPSDYLGLLGSYASGDSAWTVEIEMSSRGSTLDEVVSDEFVYAVCARGIGGPISTGDAVTFELPRNTLTSVALGSGSLSCAANKLLVGAGWKTSDPHMILTTLAYAHDDAFHLTANVFPDPGKHAARAESGRVEVTPLCIQPTPITPTNTTPSPTPPPAANPDAKPSSRQTPGMQLL